MSEQSTAVLDAIDPTNANKRHVLVVNNPTGDGTIEMPVAYDFQSFAAMSRHGKPFMKAVNELDRYGKATEVIKQETDAATTVHADGSRTVDFAALLGSERYRMAQDEADRMDMFGTVVALAIGGLNSRRYRKTGAVSVEQVYDMLDPSRLLSHMQVLRAALADAMPRQADVDAVGKSLEADEQAASVETPLPVTTTGGQPTSNSQPSSDTATETTFSV